MEHMFQHLEYMFQQLKQNFHHRERTILEDGDDAGAVTGMVGEAGSVSNCKAENCTINAVKDAGQVVGTAMESQVTMCSANNVTVAGAGTNNRNNSIIGRNLSLE